MTIADESHREFTEALAQVTEELARRAEEIRSGQAQGEPAETVLAELRKKHS